MDRLNDNARQHLLSQMALLDSEAKANPPPPPRQPRSRTEGKPASNLFEDTTRVDGREFAYSAPEMSR